MILDREEIAKLPRWAKVAFAARCANRVACVFRGTESELWAVETARRFAGSMAMEARVGVAAAEAAIAADKAAYEASHAAAYAAADDANDEADRAARAAAHAAANAATAAKAAAQAAVKGAQANAPSDANDLTAAAAAAAAHAAARAAAHCVANDNDVLSAIRRDYEHILRAATEGTWDDNTPVSQDVFGDMWPEGVPEGWPAPFKLSDLASPAVADRALYQVEVRDDEDPTFTLAVEYGEFSDATGIAEGLALVYEGLSDLHRALYGTGLTIIRHRRYSRVGEVAPCHE